MTLCQTLSPPLLYRGELHTECSSFERRNKTVRPICWLQPCLKNSLLRCKPRIPLILLKRCALCIRLLASGLRMPGRVLVLTRGTIVQYYGVTVVYWILELNKIKPWHMHNGSTHAVKWILQNGSDQCGEATLRNASSHRKSHQCSVIHIFKQQHHRFLLFHCFWHFTWKFPLKIHRWHQIKITRLIFG